MSLRTLGNTRKVHGCSPAGSIGRSLLNILACLTALAACLTVLDPAAFAQSPETVLQGLTPEQRQALQSELAKSGGKPTPELVQQLKAQQAKPVAEQTQTQAAPQASAQTMQKFAAEAERAEKELEEKTSRQGLKRFGFDYFTPSRKRIVTLEEAIGRGEMPPELQKDAVTGFIGPLDMVVSSVNASIPPTYILSPGDQITVYYWGDLIELTTLKLALDEKGEVSLPQAGRLVARGMSLPQLEKAVQNQLQRVFGKNIKLIASLDKLKSIQIFITGEAFRPGSYAVSAATTLFNALYACGGISDLGSFRDIKLVRGKTAFSVDFYDFLLNGDSKSDYPLQPGDTIFFSRAGKLVSLRGEVGRSAVYELKKDETLRDLVRMANGIKPSGLTNKVLIQSVIPHKERAVVEVDLSREPNHTLIDGDAVTVEAVIPDIQNTVTLSGAVKVPGVYELKKSMKVADLFNEVNEPWGDALLERTDVIRLDKDRRTTTAISVNLGKALQKDPEHNLPLAPLDRVVVYSKWDVKFYPARTVTIQGAVQRPGDYPRTEGMRIKDLLLMAGGALPGSMNEITISKARFHAEPKLLTLKADLLEQGDESQNLPLDDEDVVMVRSDSEFRARPLWVTIGGEVRFPGTYPLLRRDYRLSELIRQAGGLTGRANPKGAVFLRKRELLPSPEQKGDLAMIDRIVNVLNESDAKRQSARNLFLLRREAGGVEATGQGPVVGTGGPTVVATGTSTREAAALGLAPSIAQATGTLTGGIVSAFTPGGAMTSEARTLSDEQLAQSARIIINLAKAVEESGDNPEDTILMNGDSITIPQKTETVSVVGAVMNPVTAHLGKKRRVKDVVALAGGYAGDADEERALVLRVDGSIVSAEDVGRIEEGDIIYVPTKVMEAEIVTTADKIINVIKYTLATAAGVIVFLALIP